MLLGFLCDRCSSKGHHTSQRLPLSLFTVINWTFSLVANLRKLICVCFLFQFYFIDKELEFFFLLVSD